MCWTRAKLGIVNLSHATQVYPWEPKPGVYEVRAVFPDVDTLTLSDHVSREQAEERVSELLVRLGGGTSEDAQRAANASKGYPFRLCHGIHSPYSGQCEHCQPPSPQDLAEMDDKEPSFVRESHDGKLHFDDAADAAWRAKQAK